MGFFPGGKRVPYQTVLRISRAWLSTIASLVSIMACCYCQSPGSWTKLKSTSPGFGVQPHLLTDGTVILLNADTPTWMRLTPDAHGSYINGSWSTDIAPMVTIRLAFPSNMLPSGKLLVLGGEFIGGATVAARIGTGEIYDPVANTWTPTANPPPRPDCPREEMYNGTLTKGSAVPT